MGFKEGFIGLAKNRVQKLDGEMLVLIGNVRIPVARARKKEVVADLFVE